MPFKVSNHKSLKEVEAEESEFDLTDRDPNQLNSYLQAQWHDLVAEPDGIRSANCIWKASYKLFRCSRCCCYNLLSGIFFIPISLLLGLRLACLSFQHIWCFTPLLKDLKMNCFLVRSVCSTSCDTLLGPLFETIGLMCTRFKFTFFTRKPGPCCENSDAIHKI
ncbi:hypothetical protein CHUAL_004901 [Chamberlinius hualienensis]